jgi:hypothetical protein
MNDELKPFVPVFKPKQTIGQKAIGFGKDVLGGALNLINLPLSATVGAVQGARRGDFNIIKTGLEGIKNKQSFIDVFKDMGMGKVPSMILGTVGNIYLDPLHWLGPLKAAGRVSDPFTNETIKLTKSGAKELKNFTQGMDKTTDILNVMANKSKAFEHMRDVTQTNPAFLFQPGLGLKQSGKVLLSPEQMKAPFTKAGQFLRKNPTIDTVADGASKIVSDLGSLINSKFRDPIANRAQEVFTQAKGSAEIKAHILGKEGSKYIDSAEEARNLIYALTDKHQVFVNPTGELVSDVAENLYSNMGRKRELAEALLKDGKITENTFKAINKKQQYARTIGGDTLININPATREDLIDSGKKILDTWNQRPLFESMDLLDMFQYKDSAYLSPEKLELITRKLNSAESALRSGNIGLDDYFDARDAINTLIKTKDVEKYGIDMELVNSLGNNLQNFYNDRMTQIGVAVKKGKLLDPIEAWDAAADVYRSDLSRMPTELKTVLSKRESEAVGFFKEQFQAILERERANGILYPAQEAYVPHFLKTTERPDIDKISLGSRPGFTREQVLDANPFELNRAMGSDVFEVDLPKILAIRKYKSEMTIAEKNFLVDLLKLGKPIPDGVELSEIKNVISPDQDVYTLTESDYGRMWSDISGKIDSDPFIDLNKYEELQKTGGVSPFSQDLSDIQAPAISKIVSEKLQRKSEIEKRLREINSDISVSQEPAKSIDDLAGMFRVDAVPDTAVRLSKEQIANLDMTGEQIQSLGQSAKQVAERATTGTAKDVAGKVEKVKLEKELQELKDSVFELRRKHGGLMGFSEELLGDKYFEGSLPNVTLGDQIKAWEKKGRQPIDLAKETLFESQSGATYKKAGLGEKTKSFILPKEVVKYLNEYETRMRSPDVIENFFSEAYDPLQNFWKGWAMGASPGTQFRNIVGNTWSNYLAGVKNKSYGISRKMMQNFDNPEALAQIKIQTPYGVIDGNEMLADFINGGIMDKGLYGKDIDKGFAFLDTAVERAKTSTIQKVFDPKYNPLTQKMFDTQTQMENWAYLAHFVSKVEEGYNPFDAILSVKKHLFDYGDLTQFEKKVLKRVFPFYSFTRKNLPLQLEYIIKDPQKYQIISHAKWIANEMGDTQEEGMYLPDYLASALAIPLPFKDKNGNSMYWDLTDWIPAGQINMMANPLKEAVGMTSPFLKMPFELGLNLNTYYGQPISNFKGEKERLLGVPVPKKLAYIMKQLRMVNEMDRLASYKKPTYGRAFPERVLRYATGIRFDRVNPDRSKTYKTKIEPGQIEGRIKKALRESGQLDDKILQDFYQEMLENIKTMPK